MMLAEAAFSHPLPRFEAGEGEDPSRSDGEGEGLAGASLAKPSPGRLRCAPASTLSHVEAR
jgi:hypothetical protein